MNTEISPRLAFTSLIVAFILHNIEEAIFICRYPVQSPVAFIEPVNCGQFIVAVAFITAFVLITYIIAVRTNKSSLYLFISTAVSSGLVLNAIVPHITLALYTLNYTPGLITAVALNLPLGLLVLFKNRSSCESRKQFFQHIGVGLVFGYLLFAVVMGLSLFLID